ncbi:MAG: MotA/TolQ/ExbB proton channel family protein [Kiritimatiellia bacterium]
MMKALVCLLICGFLPVSAQLPEAIAQVERDVKDSTRELNELRDRIQEDRLPLARELNGLQREAAELRRQVQTIRSAKSLAVSRRENLRREVKQLTDELEFVDTVFREYRRGLETRVQVAEVEALPALLPSIREERPLPGQVEELWNATLNWHQLRTGGYDFSGLALDEEGRERSGQFAVLGPIAYFVSDSGGGWVHTRENSALPGIFPLSEAETGRIRELVNGEEVLLPLDPSLGDAIKVSRARPSLKEHLRQGGVVVVPLLILGALSLIMAIAKSLDLRSLVVRAGPEMLRMIGDLTDENASKTLAKAQKTPQAVGSLLVAVIQHRHASREHLEEIMHEHVLAVVPRLERSLGTLAVFGGVAPLLGLLGTVTGMISTFQLVTLFGSGNAKTLSGGISEALVTTQLGLVIAIPVLLVHAFLARKAKALLGELEQVAVSLVNVVKTDPGPET